MNLNELLTCKDEELHDKLNMIDFACNGIALMNSLINYMKTLNSTDERNKSVITGYILQKLCDLNGLECNYTVIYDRLIDERKKIKLSENEKGYHLVSSGIYDSLYE